MSNRFAVLSVMLTEEEQAAQLERQVEERKEECEKASQGLYGAAEFASKLKRDRLIKVYIGDDSEPYMVPETVLCNASEYFVAAIRNENFGEDNIGVLRFQEDDKDAWKYMLQHMYGVSLPKLHDHGAELSAESCTRDIDTFVRCWALGNKYLVSSFQDEIMLLMLDLLDREYCKIATYWLNGKAVEIAFCQTDSGSPLQRLLAEDVARSVAVSEDYDALKRFEDLPGFLSEYARAAGRVGKYGGGFVWAWSNRKEYLLTEGPWANWPAMSASGMGVRSPVARSPSNYARRNAWGDLEW